jgi:hypothetical protein
METKIEQLPKEVVETLKKLDSKLNEIIHLIGKIDLDIHNFEKEIKKLNSKKISLMEDYSEIKLEFDNQLKVLENRYAKGTINLNEGTIEYNVMMKQ